MTTAPGSREIEETETQNPIGKILPVQKTNVDITEEFNKSDPLSEHEKSIIEAVRLLLRNFVQKSGAAIRDAVDFPHSNFGPKEAVNAIIGMGFKASFGSLKFKSFQMVFFLSLLSEKMAMLG